MGPDDEHISMPDPVHQGGNRVILGNHQSVGDAGWEVDLPQRLSTRAPSFADCGAIGVCATWDGVNHDQRQAPDERLGRSHRQDGIDGSGEVDPDDDRVRSERSSLNRPARIVDDEDRTVETSPELCAGGSP